MSSIEGKFIHFKRLLFLMIVAWSLSGPAQSLVCSKAHGREAVVGPVAQAFSQAWGQPGVYVKDKCHSNVIRLYEELKRQYPTLQARDFQVLYITWPQGWLKNRGRFFFPQLSRRLGQSQGLRYHVVLAYKGLVFDLDLSNPFQVLPVETYLQNFVSPQDRKSLVVHFIPGPDYLTWPTEFPDFKEEFHNRIFYQTPALPLENGP